VTDLADTAADYQERLNADALANRPAGQYRGTGLERCASCGDPVGEYRRQQLNARQCVPCQMDIELAEKVRR